MSNNWLPENRNDLVAKYVLFCISPFFAAVYSVRRLNTKSSFLILFLFGALFGAAFSVQSGKTETQSLDSASYRERFESYQSVSSEDYKSGLDRLLTGEAKDYYFETVAFVLSRFTDNYHFFFFFIALVFSYFSLRSLRFITREREFGFTLTSIILLYIFLTVDVFNINGVRFWTAYWIGVYCLFQIFVNKNKRYYCLALITPAIHGTFWIFLGMLLLIRLTKRFDRFWLIMFLLSFVFSTFAIELLQNIQQYLPAALSQSIDSYTSEEYIEERRSWSGFGWLPLIFGILVKIYYNSIVLLFVKNRKAILSDAKIAQLYQVLLIWITVFNFFMVIPSLGNRYIAFIYPMIAFIWLIAFSSKNKYQNIIFLAPMVLIWSILWMPAKYLAVLNSDFFYSNPIIIVYKYLLS